MLQNTKDLYGNRIVASDGDVGTVKDFYFDDKDWVIRYLVAGTGSWMSGRLVMLSHHSIGEVDLHWKTLNVELTRKQIQDSPAADSLIPVSRQYEEEFYRYYGLPIYWPVGANSEPSADSPGLSIPRTATDVHPQRRRRGGKHLQSTKAVTGFNIEALDGLVGQVGGFFVDDRSWAVPALVIEAGHWYSEKEILISAENVDRISYDDSVIFVNLNKADIHRTPEAGLATTKADGNGRIYFHD